MMDFENRTVVITGAGGRWPGVEIPGRRERLADDARADEPPVALDQLPVRLVGEQRLRQPGDQQWVRQSEQNRGHDGHQGRGTKVLHHDRVLTRGRSP